MLCIELDVNTPDGRYVSDLLNKEIKKLTKHSIHHLQQAAVYRAKRDSLAATHHTNIAKNKERLAKQLTKLLGGDNECNPST